MIDCGHIAHGRMLM